MRKLKELAKQHSDRRVKDASVKDRSEKLSVAVELCGYDESYPIRAVIGGAEDCTLQRAVNEILDKKFGEGCVETDGMLAESCYENRRSMLREYAAGYYDIWIGGSKAEKNGKLREYSQATNVLQIRIRPGWWESW